MVEPFCLLRYSTVFPSNSCGGHSIVITIWIKMAFSKYLILLSYTGRILFFYIHISYLYISMCIMLLPCIIILRFFSCDQAALQMVFSVRPSVCPSVTPFSPCSHHRIIMKFSGVITMVKSDVHAKGQGQRSKVKVTEVNTQLSRFRILTPVWIHIWQWNDAYSLMMLRRGALLFLKVKRQISRSHSSKKRRIWPRLGVSGL